MLEALDRGLAVLRPRATPRVRSRCRLEYHGSCISTQSASDAGRHLLDLSRSIKLLDLDRAALLLPSTFVNMNSLILHPNLESSIYFRVGGRMW